MGGGYAAFTAGNAMAHRFPRLATRQPLVAHMLGACVLLALVLVTGVRLYRRDHHVSDEELPAMRACAARFAPHVPAERIVVREGTMHDEYGHPVAYNEPMMLAYMDRKGFNYGNEELSIDTLEAIAARGGRYWVVGREELVKYKREQSANAQYHRIATCDDAYYLYDLRGR